MKIDGRFEDIPEELRDGCFRGIALEALTHYGISNPHLVDDYEIGGLYWLLGGILTNGTEVSSQLMLKPVTVTRRHHPVGESAVWRSWYFRRASVAHRSGTNRHPL